MNEKVKATAQNSAKAYNTYGRAVSPFFVGGLGSELGENLGQAVQASDINVNPINFRRAGASAGFAAPFIPKSGKLVGPLMYSAIASSILNQYNAAANLADVAEAIDPLGVNRNRDNVPFFDRIVQAGSNPNLLKDVYQFGRDFSLVGNMPIVQKYTDKAAANLISKAADNWLASQGLEGYVLPPEDIEPALQNVPKYDWLWGTEDNLYEDGFIQSLNPFTWHKSIANWWDSLVGD